MSAPGKYIVGSFRLGAALCLGAILSGLTLWAQTPGMEKKTWNSLSEAEAIKGQPVQMEGTILCFDRGWGQLYIHDGHQAVYLSPHSFTNQFAVGQKVRINGITSWGRTVPILTNATARVLGRQSLPEASRLRVQDLMDSPGQWVEIHGTIRVAEVSRERISLILMDGDQKCLVYVMQTSSTNRFRHLVDAEVTLRGINASQAADGKLTAAIIFCPGLEQITAFKQNAGDRWKLPVTPIDTLLTRRLGEWTNEPVHINGTVNEYHPGALVAMKDPTGILRCEIIQVSPVLLHQRVDCWGFLTVRTNGAVLADAYFEVAGKPASEVRTAGAARPATNVIFTRIEQVRALSKEEANKNYPVVLRGVVTYVDPPWRMGFLQDDQDAIFFDASQTNLLPGQLIEVQGQTDGLGFAPDLIHCTAKILAATNVPAPLPVKLQDAANGSLDSRRVEMEGVVRRVTKENGHIALTLTSREGNFAATVLDNNTNAAPVELIDSLVTIRGACGSIANSRSQLSSVILQVPGLGEIDVLEPSPADPFAAEAIPISTVATFNPERLTGRRVKVGGVITLAMPGRTLFVQDASGGIRVAASQTNDFHAGDLVEVLGFPSLVDFSPCLEEAAIRRIGTTKLPAARATLAAQILHDGGCDGTRIKMQAQVIQSYSKNAQAKLLLQDGAIIFTAYATQPEFQSTMPEWPAGSIIQLQGICVVQGNENNEPASFHLLLASPADVKLIKGAPWWNLTRTLILLGGTTLASLLALTWVISLRQQVRKQTEIIRQNQKELLETSRLAGMAEIATNVLHNVGNVLNSVNVSAAIVGDKVKKSRTLGGLASAVELMEQHRNDLGDFIANDPRGKNLPAFLKLLAERMRSENATALEELGQLTKNIQHINDIVARQQTLAKVGGLLETVVPADLMEDALLINAGNLAQLGINLQRDYSASTAQVTVEKHKLLQILVNLVSNAKYACMESTQARKQIALRIEQAGGTLKMSVRDNGIGIAPENLLRIFNYGFTTRSNGHGFGLHSGALFAQQMGGQLTAQSNGPGEGACFTLELPLQAAPQREAQTGGENTI